MNSQTGAILWAQLRMLLNYFPRSARGGLAFGIVISGMWYVLWSAMAFFAYRLLSDPGDEKVAGLILSGGLLLISLYWQLIPVLMAATGASLEIKKLIVYPIPPTRLFALEVLLRVTSAIEMLLVVAGTAAGLWKNARTPVAAPLILIAFVAMNLFCAAGTREILARLFARKRVRELSVFLLVLCGALPQLLVTGGGPGRLKELMTGYDAPFWPWAAVAAVGQGRGQTWQLVLVFVWTALAYAFGRWQFQQGLNFDADVARATKSPEKSGPSQFDGFFRWPARVFPDPLAAMIEKEIRFLSRAPRFRLVFTMGFTFGLVIWLPIASGRATRPGLMSENYLTLVCVYALLLLGDVCFWNAFGFDRRAAQTYFVTPVRFQTVLLAKNLTALFFVLLEITAIILVCATLRMPVTLAKLAEAYSVTLVIATYLVSVGNLTSTRNPRGVNPDKSMRTGSAGQLQALLVFVYPFACLPVLLAYLARYAFENEAAFYIVLAIAAAIGGVVYWVSMESSVQAAGERREQIIDRLSQGDGLIQA